MATFYSQKYPELTIKLAKDLLIHFENGKYSTGDEREIGLLRKHKKYGAVIFETKPAAWVFEALQPLKTLEEKFDKPKKKKAQPRDEEDADLSRILA